MPVTLVCALFSQRTPRQVPQFLSKACTNRFLSAHILLCTNPLLHHFHYWNSLILGQEIRFVKTESFCLFHLCSFLIRLLQPDHIYDLIICIINEKVKSVFLLSFTIIVHRITYTNRLQLYIIPQYSGLYFKTSLSEW